MTLKTIKKVLQEYSEKSDSVAKSLGGGQLRTLLSMFYCTLRYGARPIDYERFEFKRKSAFERDRYMTFLRYFKIAKKIDRKTFTDISANKSRELEIFSDFIHRKWMLVDYTTPESEIRSFITKCKATIAKPEHGEQGRGIFKLRSENDIERLISECNSAPYIIEEVIENAEYIKEINPSSLNTVRATTFVDKTGKVNILSIILRVGIPGSYVDNWGAGGIGYNFDVEAGICDRPGKDKKNRRYIFHPGSGKKMLGLELRNFPELKKYIYRLAYTLLSAKYVGWDIAITSSGYELIEMNCPAGHDMFQSFDNPVYRFFTNNW